MTLGSSPYKIIDIEQGSPDWHNWRADGIGASDAPTIMGENPWKKPNDLLREKSSPKKEISDPNGVMARGTALEPEARSEYALEQGVEVMPACLQSMSCDWLRASLDGLSANGNKVVEIKCGESVYRRTASSGQVPGYYVGQLQHILAITMLESLDFWCYLPGRRSICLRVDRNDKYIEKLLRSESQFWQRLSELRLKTGQRADRPHLPLNGKD